MHVLGVRDERRAALRLQRGPPVDGRGAAAHGRAQPVAGHLDRPVEDLLNRSRGPLDPGLPGAAPEVLRGLHDRDLRIVQVGQRLGQEVPPGREIRVQDDQVLGAGLGERVPQVAGLLARGPVRPAEVTEAEGLRHRASVPGRAVVEHPGVRIALVVLDETQHRGPGVAEQLGGLAADGQVDVHVRVAGRPPGPDARQVGVQVESRPGEIHRHADQLIDDEDGGEQQERRQRQVLRLEPDLAEGDAARADDDDGGQVRQVPPDITVLFLVVRRMRCRAALLVRAGCKPDRWGDGSGADWPLAGHRRDSYRQITYVPGAGPAGPAPYGTTWTV